MKFQHMKDKGHNYCVMTELHSTRRVEIFNPTINRVEKGMMVRVWDSHRSRSPKALNGDVVLEVDEENNQVLVQFNSEGTLQHSKWVDCSLIHVVWDVGGYEVAMKMLKSFTKFFKSI